MRRAFDPLRLLLISVNRTATVVKPNQPFLDWLRGADPTGSELSLEDLRREPAIYLPPECESVEDTRAGSSAVFLGRSSISATIRFSGRNSDPRDAAPWYIP
jgi:hypothetical protein